MRCGMVVWCGAAIVEVAEAKPPSGGGGSDITSKMDITQAEISSGWTFVCHRVVGKAKVLGF